MFIPGNGAFTGEKERERYRKTSGAPHFAILGNMLW